MCRRHVVFARQNEAHHLVTNPKKGSNSKTFFRAMRKKTAGATFLKAHLYIGQKANCLIRIGGIGK